jgi:hypothetical protein
MWHEYAELMTDPAHCLVEFTFVLFDYVIVQTAYSLLKRHFHKDLEKRDARHGH